MAAEIVTIAECNQARISVFLDANVILKAKADSMTGGPFFVSFNRIDRPLRIYSSTTLYEVAFARKAGLAEGTLRDDQDWMGAHATWIKFTERVGRTFDVLVGPASRLVRARVDLGDALLASFVPTKTSGKEFAIATNDRDFLGLPVRVVKEFLPP